jgi:hypothetical protein
MNHTDTTPFTGERSETTARTELRDLSPTGEELSREEIELVGGGTCHFTKPGADSDFTCIGGQYD